MAAVISDVPREQIRWMNEWMAQRAAGKVTNPSGTERLHEYWVHGPGAAKIRWGQPNDFARCVEHLGKFIKDPKGYCNLAHHAALGYYPATHAAMEKHAGRAAMSDMSGGYDADGLDGSWDGDCSDLPDLSGLHVHHFEAADGTEEPASASRAAPKLGSGGRFKKLKASLAAKGAHDPGALAAWIGRKKYGKGKFMKLAAKARGGASRSEDDQPAAGPGRLAGISRGEYFRTWELEDIHIVRTAQGDSTGRLVEAYAAAFGQRAEIHDHQGHYEEENDPAAFNDELEQARRSRAGLTRIKCMYNHAMTVHGTPSSADSVPLGVPQDIRPETRGLLTRTLYLSTPRAEEVLEAIKGGAITAQSYTGRIIRSSPELRGPGDRHRARNGVLTLVRRLQLGLREYGPTPFPAFSGAEILGVRMQRPGDPGEAPEEDLDSPADEECGPGDEAAVTGSVPEDTTSARYHQHALYVLRAKERREERGLDW